MNHVSTNKHPTEFSYNERKSHARHDITTIRCILQRAPRTILSCCIARSRTNIPALVGHYLSTLARIAAPIYLHALLARKYYTQIGIRHRRNRINCTAARSHSKIREPVRSRGSQ